MTYLITMNIVFYSLLISLSILEVTSIQNYNFNDLCANASINIPHEGDISLSYSRLTPLPDNSSCIVSVFNPTKQNTPNIIASFKEFNTDFTTNCVNARLELFNGLGTDQPITGPTGICGQQANIHVYYNSSQPFMTFRFRDALNLSDFQIILTAAHSGDCDESEFKCSNGFCIKNSLICNGYNNCGNRDDQVACAVAGLAAGAVVAIVFAVLIGGLVIPMMLVCCLCRPRQRRSMYRQV